MHAHKSAPEATPCSCSLTRSNAHGSCAELANKRGLQVTAGYEWLNCGSTQQRLTSEALAVFISPQSSHRHITSQLTARLCLQRDHAARRAQVAGPQQTPGSPCLAQAGSGLPSRAAGETLEAEACFASKAMIGCRLAASRVQLGQMHELILALQACVTMADTANRTCVQQQDTHVCTHAGSLRATGQEMSRRQRQQRLHLLQRPSLSQCRRSSQRLLRCV